MRLCWIQMQPHALIPWAWNHPFLHHSLANIMANGKGCPLGTHRKGRPLGTHRKGCPLGAHGSPPRLSIAVVQSWAGAAAPPSPPCPTRRQPMWEMWESTSLPHLHWWAHAALRSSRCSPTSKRCSNICWGADVSQLQGTHRCLFGYLSCHSKATAGLQARTHTALGAASVCVLLALQWDAVLQFQSCPGLIVL